MAQLQAHKKVNFYDQSYDRYYHSSHKSSDEVISNHIANSQNLQLNSLTFEHSNQIANCQNLQLNSLTSEHSSRYDFNQEG